jgi:hypothetical protein
MELDQGNLLARDVVVESVEGVVLREHPVEDRVVVQGDEDDPVKLQKLGDEPVEVIGMRCVAQPALVEEILQVERY